MTDAGKREKNFTGSPNFQSLTTEDNREWLLGKLREAESNNTTDGKILVDDPVKFVTGIFTGQFETVPDDIMVLFKRSSLDAKITAILKKKKGGTDNEIIEALKTKPKALVKIEPLVVNKKSRLEIFQKKMERFKTPEIFRILFEHSSISLQNQLSSLKEPINRTDIIDFIIGDYKLFKNQLKSFLDDYDWTEEEKLTFLTYLDLEVRKMKSTRGTFTLDQFDAQIINPILKKMGKPTPTIDPLIRKINNKKAKISINNGSVKFEFNVELINQYYYIRQGFGPYVINNINIMIKKFNEISKVKGINTVNKIKVIYINSSGKQSSNTITPKSFIFGSIRPLNKYIKNNEELFKKIENTKGNLKFDVTNLGTSIDDGKVIIGIDNIRKIISLNPRNLMESMNKSIQLLNGMTKKNNFTLRLWEVEPNTSFRNNLRNDLSEGSLFNQEINWNVGTVKSTNPQSFIAYKPINMRNEKDIQLNIEFRQYDVNVLPSNVSPDFVYQALANQLGSIQVMMNSYYRLKKWIGELDDDQMKRLFGNSIGKLTNDNVLAFFLSMVPPLGKQSIEALLKKKSKTGWSKNVTFLTAGHFATTNIWNKWRKSKPIINTNPILRAHDLLFNRVNVDDDILNRIKKEIQTVTFTDADINPNGKSTPIRVFKTLPSTLTVTDIIDWINLTSVSLVIIQKSFREAMDVFYHFIKKANTQEGQNVSGGDTSIKLLDKSGLEDIAMDDDLDLKYAIDSTDTITIANGKKIDFGGPMRVAFTGMNAKDVIERGVILTGISKLRLETIKKKTQSELQTIEKDNVFDEHDNYFKFINKIRDNVEIFPRWDEKDKKRSFMTLTSYRKDIQNTFPWFDVFNVVRSRIHQDLTSDSRYQRSAEKNIVDLVNIHLDTVYEQLLQKKYQRNAINLIRSFYYSTMSFDPWMLYGYILNNYGSTNVNQIIKKSVFKNDVTNKTIFARNISVLIKVLDGKFGHFAKVLRKTFRGTSSIYNSIIEQMVNKMDYDKINKKTNTNSVPQNITDLFKNTFNNPSRTFIAENIPDIYEKLYSILNLVQGGTNDEDLTINAAQLENLLKEPDVLGEHYKIINIMHDFHFRTDVVDIGDPTIIEKLLSQTYFSYRNQFPGFVKKKGDKNVDGGRNDGYPNDNPTDPIDCGGMNQYIGKDVGKEIRVSSSFENLTETTRKQQFSTKMFSNIILQKVYELENKRSNQKLFANRCFSSRLSSLKSKVSEITAVYDNTIIKTNNKNQKAEVLEFISFMNQIRIMEVILPSIYIKDREGEGEGDDDMIDDNDNRKKGNDLNEFDVEDVREFYNELKSNKIFTGLNVLAILYVNDDDVDFLHRFCENIVNDTNLKTPHRHISLITVLNMIMVALRTDNDIKLDGSIVELTSGMYKKLSYILMFMELVKTGSIIASSPEDSAVGKVAMVVWGFLNHTLKNFSEYSVHFPVTDVKYLGTPNMEWFTDIYYDHIMTSDMNIVNKFEDHLTRIGNDGGLLATLSDSKLIKSKFQHQFMIAFKTGGSEETIKTHLARVLFRTMVFMDSIKAQSNQLKKVIGVMKKNPNYVLEDDKELLEFLMKIHGPKNESTKLSKLRSEMASIINFIKSIYKIYGLKSDLRRLTGSGDNLVYLSNAFRDAIDKTCGNNNAIGRHTVHKNYIDTINKIQVAHHTIRRDLMIPIVTETKKLKLLMCSVQNNNRLNQGIKKIEEIDQKLIPLFNKIINIKIVTTDGNFPVSLKIRKLDGNTGNIDGGVPGLAIYKIDDGDGEKDHENKIIDAVKKELELPNIILPNSPVKKVDPLTDVDGDITINGKIKSLNLKGCLISHVLKDRTSINEYVNNFTLKKVK